MQVVPYVLGIVHGTGYPLFTLVGWAFTHALPFSNVVWRIDLLCALCIALAALGVRALALGFGAGRLAALGAALAFAFSEPVWQKGINADGHAAALALIVLALVLVQRALATRSAAFLIAAAAADGFAMAVHPTALWVLPGLALAAVLVRDRLRPATALATLGALVAPLALYAYVPLRYRYIAAHGLDPNAGPPLFGAGSVFWGHPGMERFADVVRQVSGPEVGAGGTALQAFDLRRWPGFGLEWLHLAQPQLSTLLLVLALAGALAVAVRARALLAVAVAGFGAVPFAMGFAPIESDIGRYLLPSYATACALAASAPALLSAGAPRRIAAGALGLLLLALAGWQFQRHSFYFHNAAGRGNLATIEAVRANTPDDAIVLAGWLDLPTLAYARYVEPSLGRRLLVGAWPSEPRERLRRWARSRRVFVVSNYILRNEIERVLPKPWLHRRSPRSDPAIVEVVP